MQTEFGSLELVAAKWVLGRIPSEALPRIASDLLEAGPDTPTLRHLAGELHPRFGDSGPLFEEILDELGVAVPDMSRAGLVLAKAYATQIIEGSLCEYDGARQIWQIQMEVEGLTSELGPFVYWASEWDEAGSPEERRECEAGIRAAAVKFAGAS
jgi:hypothetical protein